MLLGACAPTLPHSAAWPFPSYFLTSSSRFGWTLLRPSSLNLSMYTTPSRWSNSCWKILAFQSVNFILNGFPFRVFASTFTHEFRFTSPLMPGNERHASNSDSCLSDLATIFGFTNTVSFSHAFSFPSGLNTKRRIFFATCGAASPTPLLAYMTLNISLANFARSSSKSVTSAFSVLRDGCGYFTILSDVPSTSPGSNSPSAITSADIRTNLRAYLPSFLP
mmetsp:Transcript_884/g.2836  ORF Transcript_884/g.2836 Transcript_884/m.2836 type:complete len:221 (-) Transcript_884:166-828(-)